MNILLVTDAYPPEIRSASHLMQELAIELKHRGHRVTVVTCRPRYNLSSKGKNQVWKPCCFEEGIRVIRIQTLPHHKVNFIIRGISQLSLPYVFWRKLKQYLEEPPDAVIVYSPPLTLWEVGRAVKHKYGSKFLLNVQDIFPQNAIDLGILNNPVLIRFFESMEKHAYDNADLIAVHSVSNRNYLISKKGLLPDKVSVLHNWVDIGGHNGQFAESKFRKEFRLGNKFIFFFGGVIGPSQGLDLVIEAASRMATLHDIIFLLVGDGSEVKKLQGMIQERSLSNVLIQPLISKEEYRQLLREINVGLVCLSSKNMTPVVPGKLLGYMAASVPVLALLNKESDGHEVVRASNCGYSEISDCPEKAAALMVKMYKERDRLKEVGENGFRYAVAHFSKEVCVDQLEQYLNVRSLKWNKST